jgi:glycosyltransferase involved in cell wall biosynthesis
VSGDLWAGAEVSAFHLIRELAARRDVSVHVLVLNDGVLHARLSAEGIPTKLLPEGRLGFSAILRAGLTEARRIRPDVIHSHRYKEHLLGAIVSLRTGTAHVRSAHGLSPELAWEGKLVGVGAKVDEMMSDWMGSTWIAVSSDLGRRMDGLRRRIHVVPNGLPGRALPPVREVLEQAFGAPEPSWYVGFVGRLEPVKRPDRFLRLVALLPERIAGRAVRAVVVGDGSMRSLLEKEIAGSALRSRVRFLGSRPDADRIVGALDVLAVPSDHEGHPMVLLEAMRAGVPVVCSAVGGIPEVLGEAPWVVAPGDEEGMASATARLLSEPDSRESWTGHLQETFRSRYTIAGTADRVLEIYAHD